MPDSTPGEMPPEQFALDPAAVVARVGELFRTHDPHIESRPLEQRRVEVLQRIYSSLFASDFSQWDELCWPDLEMQTLGPKSVPLTGSWCGLEEILAAMRRNFAWLEQQNFTPQTVVAQGDFVVVVAYEEGIYRLTGKRYRLHVVQEFLFQEDRLKRIRQIVDGLQLLEAIWDHPKAGQG